MTVFFLIRHGQTDWNVEGRWQGQADVPLNSRGREQAIVIAIQMRYVGLKAIYSSDLKRAIETAEEISRRTNIAVIEDSRLREIHQGEWQGLHVSEIEDKYKDVFNLRRSNPLYIAPPGGEMVVEVRDRVVDAVQDIAGRHPSSRVAIVSHGFALAVIQIHYMNRLINDVWNYVPNNDDWRILIGNNRR